MATDKAMLGIYEHISELEKKIDEKDAMIDWLSNMLQTLTIKSKNYWKEAAQEAVKRDERL